MKWHYFTFDYEELDYHPHAGAEMPAGWVVHDPWGKYLFKHRGSLRGAKGALIERLQREISAMQQDLATLQDLFTKESK